MADTSWQLVAWRRRVFPERLSTAARAPYPWRARALGIGWCTRCGRVDAMTETEAAVRQRWRVVAGKVRQGLGRQGGQLRELCVCFGYSTEII